MAALFRHLLVLAGRGFWGDIHIRMTDGKIALVKVTEDFKADTLPVPPPESAGAVDAQMRELVRQLKASPVVMR